MTQAARLYARCRIYPFELEHSTELSDDAQVMLAVLRRIAANPGYWKQEDISVSVPNWIPTRRELTEKGFVKDTGGRKIVLVVDRPANARRAA